MHEFKMGKDYIKDENFELWIENGIIFSTYSPQLEFNFKIAKRLVELRLKISKGEKMPLFTDMRNLKLIDKAGRDYLSKQEATGNISAEAFVIRNESQRLIASLFISYYKCHVPSKLFDNDDKAIWWLNLYKNFN
jgi:hypothetical protein